MEFINGDIVAVYSLEETFFLAKLVNTSNKHKIKIKWFEKVHATKKGTKFTLGHEDSLQRKSIICKINLIKISRFSFLLANEEEQKILTIVGCEEDTKGEDDKTDEQVTTNEDNFNIPIEITEIKSPINTANVINKICFNETQTISNKSPPNINENYKCILLGESYQPDVSDKQTEDADAEIGNSISTITRNEGINIEEEENYAMISPHDVNGNRKCIFPDECQPNPSEDASSKDTERNHIEIGRNIESMIVITENINVEKEENNRINVISDILLQPPNKKTTYQDLSDSTPSPPFVDSGSEYLPSSDHSDIEIPLIRDIQVSANSNTNVTQKRKKILSSSESEDGIVVNCSTKSETGSRIYDKKHVCYFCYKPMSKMTRHLAVVHSSELEIARLLALPENSVERREGFLCILRAGNYFHNVEVLSTKKGELILSRRPSYFNNSSFRKYGPCPNCLGFFLISNLWHHIKYSCPKKTYLASSIQNKNVSRRDIRGESQALIGQNVGVSQEYQKHILSNFKSDDIGQLCRQDSIIVKFGCLLYEKYTAQQYEHIRQTMRQLSRLVLEIKKLDSGINTLEATMLPKNFDILIAAVQQLCVASRNDAHSRVYGIPSLALKLGHSLRKCSLIVRGIALRKGDLVANREMESFLDLMTLEWNTKVSSAALRTLKEKQINATQLLPITSDIMKLNTYLDLIIQQLQQDKNLMLSFSNWQKLAQATLCRIVLFNKRRSGEAARMTLNQYAVRPSWSEQCTTELKESLTPLENNLANNLTVVEVIGKSRKNFKVPILLTQEMKAAVDKLVETRDQVGIARNNIFIFARGGGSERPLRGHDCLRKFAKDANLEQPSSVTSTKLRKYIATVVQVLDLKHKEYDWLARHLGHDIRIHREFYRLHESAVELTKISRLLLTLDKGEINKFKGKSLDEINIADLPDIESDPDNVNEDEDEESEEDKEVGPSGADLLPTKAEQKLLRQDKFLLSPQPAAERQRRPWSPEEREALLIFFRSNIRHSIVPKKEDAEKCIAENKPILDTRSWRDVKNWVYNKIKSLKGKK